MATGHFGNSLAIRIACPIYPVDTAAAGGGNSSHLVGNSQVVGIPQCMAQKGDGANRGHIARLGFACAARVL